MGQQRRGAVKKRAPARIGAPGPFERRGTPSSGRIITLMIGQGHGFIRLANGQEVFFHRSDVREGVSFNEFAVGDAVTFELLDDRISGARAVQVDRRKPRR